MKDTDSKNDRRHPMDFDYATVKGDIYCPECAISLLLAWVVNDEFAFQFDIHLIGEHHADIKCERCGELIKEARDDK